MQSFRAFTNLPEAELFVNGKSCGIRKADGLCVVEWGGIRLHPGENHVRVTGTKKQKHIEDQYTCFYEE